MLTDFHSHILPGVDDGSENVDLSLQMLRLQAQQGVHRVVLTPHFYPRYDDPERFLRRRALAMERLCSGLDPELPELVLGAEVHYFPGMSDSDILSQLTIGEKRYILVEMPQPPWTDKMYRELEGIYVKQGLRPIVAHIDRYIAPFQTQGIPQRLEALPVLVQANSSFFTQRHTTSLALRLLKQDRIHLLGTDCHNMTDRRPDLGGALEVIRKKLGDSGLEQIQGYEQRIFDR